MRRATRFVLSLTLVSCGARTGLDLPSGAGDASTPSSTPRCLPGDVPVSIEVPFFGDMTGFGNDLYITNADPATIGAVSKDLGTPRTLITPEDWHQAYLADPGSHTSPARPVVDATGIYFLDFPYAFMIPRTGGVPRKLQWADGEDITRQLALDDRYVYQFWGTWQRVPKSGGAATTLAIELVPGMDVAPGNSVVHGSDLIWASGIWASGTKIWRANKSGGAPQQLADISPFGSDQLLLDGDTLYVADQGLVNEPGMIGAIPTQGGRFEELVDRAPACFAAKDESVYWAEWTTGDAVWRRDPAGVQTPLYRIPEGTFVHDMVVDESCLYWLTMHPGDRGPGVARLTRAPR